MEEEMLRILGCRPNPEAVEGARQALVAIDMRVSSHLDKNLASAQEEKEMRGAAEKEKLPYLSVIQLDIIHQSYEDALKKMSKPIESNAPVASDVTSPSEVERILEEVTTKKSMHLDLSSRALRCVPSSLADMCTLSSLNLSNNQLEALPNSIKGLVNLVTLDVQSNQLRSLPDAIGSLSKLKNLNVSGNLLKALPDSLAGCSKMVELSATFNQLETWPANLGPKLIHLRKLYLQLNNLVGLPPSIGELRSLQLLDLHSNKLIGLPSTLGRLTALETLDVSRNFNTLSILPDTLGNLTSLTFLDVSFNQIRELPSSLGQLKSLKRLKLDQNPLVVPPRNVVQHSHEAIMAYLLDRLENGGPKDVEEETKNGVGQGRNARSSATACMMIPMSPRHEPPGSWVPVRPGSTWARTFLGHFMCGGGAGNVMTSKTMRWQEYHSDDED